MPEYRAKRDVTTFDEQGPHERFFHDKRVLRRVVVLVPLDQQERSLGLSKQRVAPGSKRLASKV